MHPINNQNQEYDYIYFDINVSFYISISLELLSKALVLASQYINVCDEQIKIKNHFEKLSIFLEMQ